MGIVRIRVVLVVGVKIPRKQIPLPRHRTALHMHTIDKAVLHAGIAPIPAPDQPAAVRELTEKREVALPRRLAANHTHNVASQTELMYAHGSQLGRSRVEQFLLAFLAAVSLKDHYRDAYVAGCIHDLLHQLPRDWFQQQWIGDAQSRSEPGIVRDYIGEEIPHGRPPGREGLNLSRIIPKSTESPIPFKNLSTRSFKMEKTERKDYVEI